MSNEPAEARRAVTHVHGEAAARRVDTVLADCATWGRVDEINHVHGSIVSIDFGSSAPNGERLVTNLTLDMLAWRLCDVEGQTVLASEFSSKQMQTKLQVLMGASLASIKVNKPNAVDLILQFSTGHCLLTFDHCDTFPDDFDAGDDFFASLPDAYCAWWVAPTRDEYLCCCPGGRLYIESYS